jgi:hypothetical protein
MKLQDYMCSHITHACSNQSTSLLSDPSKGTCYPLDNYVLYHHYKTAHHSFVVYISQVTEPRTYSDVVIHLEWQKVMQPKLQAFYDNDTWTFTHSY